jgi:GntR family transcriptional regulator/MocR family aminotransferase
MSRIVLVGLRPDSSEPLYRQIYDGLRRQILDGRLHRGTRLPSSRDLAHDLRVARSTVVQAFDQLRAEGYIETIRRGTTRVSHTLPESRIQADRSIAPRSLGTAGTGSRGKVAPPAPSRRAIAVANAWTEFPVVLNRPARAFRTSVPALDIFPVDLWGRLTARQWRRSPAASLGYADTVGLPALRRAIADYVTTARGVRCTADQVIVTSGSQQALDLVARVLLDPGDRVWMEDPGYFGAGGALTAAGATLVPVPVDREGLDVAEGIRRARGARLAFVTPARQLPLGMTMSLARRLALLAWARDERAWILEDDYDSEFRYSTRPLSSLQSLDESGGVIFSGTFSKVMFPALRLGYLIVPEGLVDVFTLTRRYLDLCPPYLTQSVMAAFIEEGHFSRHIRRMRSVYDARRRLLVSLLTRELAALADIDSPDSGMNLTVWLPRRMSDTEAVRALAAADIDALPLSAFALRRRLRPALLLGFSGIREPDLRDGAATLGAVLRRMAKSDRLHSAQD